MAPTPARRNGGKSKIFIEEVHETFRVRGKALRAARKKLGLSLRRLADRVNVSAQYLCILEQAKEAPVRKELKEALERVLDT